MNDKKTLHCSIIQMTVAMCVFLLNDTVKKDYTTLGMISANQLLLPRWQS